MMLTIQICTVKIAMLFKGITEMKLNHMYICL